MNPTKTINWNAAKEAIRDGSRVRRADWPTEWNIRAKGDGSGDFQWHDGVTYRAAEEDAAFTYEVVAGDAK